MKDQVNQITIAYNGDIIITGRVNGRNKHWAFTQQQMLELLKASKPKSK